MSLFEILTILTLGLVFLGPEKLPPLARQLGRLMRQLRRASDEIRQTLEMEGLREDMRRQFEDVRKLKKDLTLDPYSMIRKEEQAWRDTLTGTFDPHKDQSWEDEDDAYAQEKDPDERDAHSDPQSSGEESPAPAQPAPAPPTSSAHVVLLPDQDGRPRVLDTHLRAIPLPERIGWGSPDAQIELTTLPAVPVGLLVEVARRGVSGGPLEVLHQRAQHQARKRALSKQLQAIPVIPRLWGSKRARGSALQAVPLKPVALSLRARPVSLPAAAPQAHAQEEAS